MKTLSGFVRKESYHILRDGRTLILLFVIPIILVLLFGYAITTEIRDAEIAILDKSRDAASEAVIDKILASGYFILTNELRTSHDLERAFKDGDVKLAVAFPESFYYKLNKYSRSSVQIIANAGDPNTANTLRNYVTGIIRDYQAKEMLKRDPPATIVAEVRMLYNPSLESAYYFVPGVITVIITLVCAMMTSVTIAREKERGTMEILLVSPLKPGAIVIGKSFPYTIIAMINALTVLYIGHVVFGMPVAGSLALLIAECFLFVLTSLSMGLLISALVKTQRVALMISLIGLFLPTMLLSGFIFPIESMPVVLQWISNIVPAKWFIIIIKSIMLKGSGMQTIWMATVILIGMTIFFLTMSMKKFSIRLE